MSTRASGAAVDIAAELSEAGFGEVTATQVQRWREHNLLGEWRHDHAGGPGSRAVPPHDVLTRARIVARLRKNHRKQPLVTLLMVAVGAVPEVAEVRSAVKWVFQELPPVAPAEAHEMAREIVATNNQGRRARHRTRSVATDLEGVPDVNEHDTESARSEVERVADVQTAVLAALLGDPDDLVAVPTDAIALVGGPDLARDLGLFDGVEAAAFGADFATTVAAMTNQLRQLDSLKLDDVEAVAHLFSSQNHGAVDDVVTIPQPEFAVVLVAMSVLSQVALPGVLLGLGALTEPPPSGTVGC